MVALRSHRGSRHPCYAQGSLVVNCKKPTPHMPSVTGTRGGREVARAGINGQPPYGVVLTSSLLNFVAHFEVCNRAVNCSSSRRTASYMAGVGSASAPSIVVAKPFNEPFIPANCRAAALSPCCFAAP